MHQKIIKAAVSAISVASFNGLSANTGKSETEQQQSDFLIRLQVQGSNQKIAPLSIRFVLWAGYRMSIQSIESVLWILFPFR